VRGVSRLWCRAYWFLRVDDGGKSGLSIKQVYIPEINPSGYPSCLGILDVMSSMLYVLFVVERRGLTE
jgi:hypothetical protein